VAPSAHLPITGRSAFIPRPPATSELSEDTAATLVDFFLTSFILAYRFYYQRIELTTSDHNRASADSFLSPKVQIASPASHGTLLILFLLIRSRIWSSKYRVHQRNRFTIPTLCRTIADEPHSLRISRTRTIARPTYHAEGEISTRV